MAVTDESGTVVEAVVADDGSAVIPAEELAALGLVAGARLALRVVAAPGRRSVRGALAGLPELTWEDFERASRSAREDLTGAPGVTTKRALPSPQGQDGKRGPGAARSGPGPGGAPPT